jgi:hypothetical protein
MDFIAGEFMAGAIYFHLLHICKKYHINAKYMMNKNIIPTIEHYIRAN